MSKGFSLVQSTEHLVSVAHSGWHHLFGTHFLAQGHKRVTTLLSFRHLVWPPTLPSLCLWSQGGCAENPPGTRGRYVQGSDSWHEWKAWHSEAFPWKVSFPCLFVTHQTKFMFCSTNIRNGPRTRMTDWHPSHRKSGQTVSKPIMTLFPSCWPLSTAFINMCHGCSSVTNDLIQLGICLNYKKFKKYGKNFRPQVSCGPVYNIQCLDTWLHFTVGFFKGIITSQCNSQEFRNSIEHNKKWIIKLVSCFPKIWKREHFLSH